MVEIIKEFDKDHFKGAKMALFLQQLVGSFLIRLNLANNEVCLVLPNNTCGKQREKMKPQYYYE